MEISVIGNRSPGIEVTGVDAKRFTGEDIAEIKLALAQHGVACIRNQDLQLPDLVTLANKFGEIQQSTRDQFWHPDQPEIFVISNIVENGRLIGSRDDGVIWHTDLSYLERPTGYTILYGVETPEVGADTLFASTRYMYDDATEEERKHYESLDVLYSHARVFKGRLTQKQIDDFPDVVHPLVRTHPVDGKKGLYFSSYQSGSVIGMPFEESDSFIKSLHAKATAPGRVYAHKWRPGDIVMWDNRGLIHTASEYDMERYRRLIWRITVMGERPS